MAGLETARARGRKGGRKPVMDAKKLALASRMLKNREIPVGEVCAAARFNGRSLSSGGLAREYGFTDLNGSRPDAWRYIAEVQGAGRPADTTGYR